MNPFQPQVDAIVNHKLQQLEGQLNQRINAIAANSRKNYEQVQVAQMETLQKMEQGLSAMGSILSGLNMNRSQGSGQGITRIEQIPGKRVPFDYYVTIPINAGDSTEQSQTFTVSQEGPFVATHRWAVFVSRHQIQVTVDETTSTFFTRSYGRQRPVHSVTDLLDGHAAMTTTLSNPYTSGAYVAALGLPSNISNFRSMEFDGLISVSDQGTTLPRQNAPIPTSQWAEETNKAVPLSALDLFERGTIVQFTVKPLHINNPAAGNVNGQNVFGAAGWPFLAGQYDPHEGIVTPGAFTVTDEDGITPIVSDIVERVPNGELYIGFRGYRIFQPPGFAGI